MLVAFPPTVAEFLTGATKPEAFTSIDPATLEQVLGAEADRCVVVALSDRATFPILQIDEGFRDCIFNRAARRLMGSRGYNRDAGADEEIVKLAEDADKYLEMCAPGTDGKRVTPLYVDSKANTVIDGVRVTSSTNADGWAQGRLGRQLRRGGCC